MSCLIIQYWSNQEIFIVNMDEGDRYKCSLSLWFYAYSLCNKWLWLDLSVLTLCLGWDYTHAQWLIRVTQWWTDAFHLNIQGMNKYIQWHLNRKDGLKDKGTMRGWRVLPQSKMYLKNILHTIPHNDKYVIYISIQTLCYETWILSSGASCFHWSSLRCFYSLFGVHLW